MCEPAVFNVTENVFVPETRAALDGRVAAPSLDVIATVGVALVTTFQYASTALTVTVTAEPAVTADGDPDLPVTEPGSADSPGRSTCNFVTPAVFTVNVPAALAVETEPSVAEIVRPLPAIVGVSDTESTRPPFEIVAVTVPTKAVEVSATAPVKSVFVWPFVSWAVTRTENAEPAVLAADERDVVPPVIVRANFVTAPNGFADTTSSVGV